MAKKLNATEFLDRHWREADIITGLFNGSSELQYSQIRKKLGLNGQSESNCEFIRHETQMTRILKALCSSGVLKKKKKGHKTFYTLQNTNIELKDSHKCRIAVDKSDFEDMIIKNKELEDELIVLKNRVYELNLEIGRLISENIELKGSVDSQSLDA